jgi:hypothetical protein
MCHHELLPRNLTVLAHAKTCVYPHVQGSSPDHRMCQHTLIFDGTCLVGELDSAHSERQLVSRTIQKRDVPLVYFDGRATLRRDLELGNALIEMNDPPDQGAQEPIPFFVGVARLGCCRGPISVAAHDG